MTTKNRDQKPGAECIDCAAAGTITRRPAPYPGPRCHEHARAAGVFPCIDCTAAGITTRRPIALNREGFPVPGPRCTTHHRAATKAARKRNADRRVEAVYGISDADYDQILIAQGGTCAICGKARGIRRRLAVDHDHKTGAVRGLLCDPCNRVVIGRYDTAALTRAITYLLDPPAPRALGRTVIVPNHPDTTETDQ